MVACCHNSFSPFPCYKTHSSFCCINIHQLDYSLAWEPLSLLVPWLIFISHAPCLPYLSPFFPHSMLYSLNEVSALELSLCHRPRSLRKNIFSVHEEEPNGKPEINIWDKRRKSCGVRSALESFLLVHPSKQLQRPLMQSKQWDWPGQKPRWLRIQTGNWDSPGCSNTHSSCPRTPVCTGIYAHVQPQQCLLCLPMSKGGHPLLPVAVGELGEFELWILIIQIWIPSSNPTTCRTSGTPFNLSVPVSPAINLWSNNIHLTRLINSVK